MIKRITSIILCLSIILCSFNIVFCSNKKSNITLKYIGHGEFQFIDQTINNAKIVKDIYDLQPGTAVTAEFSDDGIYHLCNSLYLIQCSEKTFALSEIINFECNNLEDIDSMNDFRISSEVKDLLRKEYSQCVEVGMTKCDFEIFIPAILNNAHYSNAPTETTETSYYSYNGYSFKTVLTKTSNKSSGMINKTGTSVLGIAQNLLNLTISAAGVSSVSIGIFGVGLSAYSLFADIFGPVTIAMSGDFISSNLIYDKYNKVTYVQIGGLWNIGNVSYSAATKSTDTYQYYQSKGIGNTVNKPYACQYYSENYTNPAPVALSYSLMVPSDTYSDGLIYYRLYNTWVKM